MARYPRAVMFLWALGAPAVALAGSPFHQLNSALDEILVGVQIECVEWIVTDVDDLVSDVVQATATTNADLGDLVSDLQSADLALSHDVLPRIENVQGTLDDLIVPCVTATATCTNGVLTVHANDEETTLFCMEYACGAGTCKTSCSSDNDCNGPNFYCDDGACRVVGAPVCTDQVGTSFVYYASVEDGRGNVTPCGPYTCEGGVCRTSCGTTSDCQAGHVCDTAASTCVVPGQ